MKKIPLQDKIKSEIKRFKKFQKVLLNKSETVSVNDIDVRNYVKFILQEGEVQEKRDLFGCFKNEIVLENKKLFLR